MELSIKDIGRMINSMERVKSSGQMELLLKETIRMDRRMGLAF